ncbi:MAG: YidH family protein [Brevibacterium linens]
MPHTVCRYPRRVSENNSSQDSRSRIARRVFPDGVDPDPRFTLANERTFLSWIRTALAFIGGGIAVEAFTSEIFSTGLRATLSIVLMVIGFILAAGAAFRWPRIESAMRRKTSLPLPLIIPIVSLASALGAGLLVLVFAGLLR